MSVSMIFNDHQEEKTVAAPPSEEELNPYSIFPQPEENFKVP
jgi:glutaminyl-tRNA synthetase